ncbi:hypothetical protein [Paraburkholderia domus]|uniref:aspartate racemase/maleate isomerase family protein n=1 Tax=Paraburkholderia domus TaxID=2793075 RepID=UPI001EEFF532|nr:hypothetical protein [Paraburkholderia domus]
MSHPAERGTEVVSHASRPCRTPFEQAMLDPHTLIELASQLPGGYDALIISCAGVRVSGVIGPIEQMIARPVVTSNAALLWYCLRTLNIGERPSGYGRLMHC